MKILIILSLLSLTTSGFARDLETLVIGCTHKCYLHESAIKHYARTLGLKVEVVRLLKHPETKLEDLDGLLVPGGADIDPKYYIESVEPELQEHIRSLDHLVDYSGTGKIRDALEYNLLKEYFSRSDLSALPVLGICRGMQMLAVTQGIPLYVDIKTELGIRNRRFVWDQVETNGAGEIMRILFPESFQGFEIHHQGIRTEYFLQHQDRWPEIELVATSHQGRIVEAIEFKNRPILGVQFHPELDFGSEKRKIFTWLLQKSNLRRGLRDH